jgi:hypothetical protein
MSRNSKPPLQSFVVTVELEHFVNARATDQQQAGKRALENLAKRFGVGGASVNSRANVTEVEAYDG